MIPTKPAPEELPPSTPEEPTGAEPGVAPALPKPDPRHQEALRARLATRPVATMVILAAIAAVYGLELLLGGGDSLPVLSALGGLSRPAVLEQHEVWRLVSHAFVHAGFVHVAMNGWVLYVIGVRVEQMLGTARFVVYYTAAVLGGGLMTLFTSDAIITVGASGGLFGLLAAEAAFVFTSRSHLLPPHIRSARQRAAVINLALNIGISLQPHISLSAHAGGAIVGAALMLLGFAPHASDTSTTSSLPLRGLAGLATLTLAAGLVLGVGFSGALTLHGAPALVRRDIPALGWSAEVPDGLTAHEPTVTPQITEVVFGDIASDPALIALARIPRDDAPSPENDEAQLAGIAQLFATPPDQATTESVTRTTVGGDPAVLGRYSYESGLVMRRLAVVRPTDLVRVETLVWSAFEGEYGEASATVAASLRPL